jgi:hypothetical protein
MFCFMRIRSPASSGCARVSRGTALVSAGGGWTGRPARNRERAALSDMTFMSVIGCRCARTILPDGRFALKVAA